MAKEKVKETKKKKDTNEGKKKYDATTIQVLEGIGGENLWLYHRTTG